MSIDIYQLIGIVTGFELFCAECKKVSKLTQMPLIMILNAFNQHGFQLKMIQQFLIIAFTF